MSWAWPGVITMPMGRPSALVRALILVEKPPRERPSALVSVPPFRRGALVRPHDGGVDHLQSRVRYFAASQRLQDHVPHAAVGPATELPPDRIPLAQLLRYIAPRRAGAHHPEDRVEHPTVIARRTPATTHQERGITGMVSIAKALNDRGVRTARGGRWHVSTVRNLLVRSKGA